VASSYSEYSQLNFERTDRVLTVSLAPDTQLNGVNGPLHSELSTVFAAIRGDRETDVVVLTGHQKAFSSGADITWLRDMSAAERDVVFVEAYRIVTDLLDVPQPIIAAIEGPAVGFGATLALFCDVKFAAADAIFGDPHVKVGVVAGDGGAVIWPSLMGVGRAKRFLMTGDLLSAQQAFDFGLVDQIVPPGESLTTAKEFAARLSKGHRAAIQGTKASINKILKNNVNLILDTSLALEKETMASDGHRDAVASFLARKKSR
jgi:enoyl-CoA hydratase